MNLRLLTVVALLGTACASYAMEDKEYKMPNADVLRERFSDIGMDHFVEKTTIIKDLADQELYAIGVPTAVEAAIADYNEYMKKGNPGHARMLAVQMQMHKPLIIKAVLQDHPDALNELEKEGLYKPAGKK